MLNKRMMLLLAIVLAGGCSSGYQPPAFYPLGAVDYPHPAKSAPTYQRKLWSVQHWDDVASHVANRLVRELCQCRRPTIGGWVLYVHKPQNNSDFTDAFHELLITQLVNRGFQISEDPYSAGVPMTYQVQTIDHRNMFHRKGPDNEVLVTTSVMSGDQYLARISDTYYVADYDMGHYYSQAPERRIQVTGR